MKGKFIEGNNPLAISVSIMVFIVSMIVTSIITTNTGERILTIPFVFVNVGLTLGIGYLLTRGKFSADEKGVEFKVGFLKYYYSYRQIVSVKTETILENGRYGKIPYVQIALSLKNGEIMTFCDQIPRNEADTLESMKDYQNEHKFTELCKYIKNRIS
ncbi:MAG: hypothetical protein K2N27_12280 [Ruminococcus sp.]|nr:hypothetical protein [Ruminococcus sp.]